MAQIFNDLGQPVGHALPDWKPPPVPPREAMEGRFCRLEALVPQRHAEDLYAVNTLDADDRIWTYLPYGPFDSFKSYRTWMETCCQSDDPLFFAIIPKSSGTPAGVASYLRISPPSGSIEVGHIHYGGCIRKSAIATEAMFLMMMRAFELGYRRYEWKCDALNAASRAAAQRLGLSYEGTFRQAMVYKGRSRDTSWYAAIDAEWPALHRAFSQWLDPGNFDQHGRQRTRLSDLTQPILKARG